MTDDQAEHCSRTRGIVYDELRREEYPPDFEPSHRRVWVDGRSIPDEDAYPAAADILNEIWWATLDAIDEIEEGVGSGEEGENKEVVLQEGDNSGNAPQDTQGTAGESGEHSSAMPETGPQVASDSKSPQAAQDQSATGEQAGEDKENTHRQPGDTTHDTGTVKQDDTGASQPHELEQHKTEDMPGNPDDEDDDDALFAQSSDEDEQVTQLSSSDDAAATTTTTPGAGNNAGGPTVRVDSADGGRDNSTPAPSRKSRPRPPPSPIAVSEPDEEAGGELQDQLVEFSDDDSDDIMEDEPDIDPVEQQRLDDHALFQSFMEDDTVVQHSKELTHKRNTKQWTLAVPACEKRVARLQALCAENMIPKSLLKGEYTQLVQLYNEASTHLLEANDMETAHMCLKKADILTDPQHGTVMLSPLDTRRARSTTMNNYAVYYRRRNKLHAARNALEQALGLMPAPEKDDPFELFESRASSHINMATTMSQLGKHQSAYEHARVGIQLLETNRSEKLKPQEEDESTASSGVQLLSVAYYTRGVEQEFLKHFSDAVVSYNKAKTLAESYLPEGHPLTKRFTEAASAATEETKKNSGRLLSKKKHGIRIAPPEGTLEHQIENGARGPTDSPRTVHSPYTTRGQNFFKDTKASEILNKQSAYQQSVRENRKAARQNGYGSGGGGSGVVPSSRPHTRAALGGTGVHSPRRGYTPVNTGPRSRTAPPHLPRVQTARSSHAGYDDTNTQYPRSKSQAAQRRNASAAPPIPQSARSRPSPYAQPQSLGGGGQARPVTAPAPKHSLEESGGGGGEGQHMGTAPLPPKHSHPARRAQSGHIGTGDRRPPPMGRRRPKTTARAGIPRPPAAGTRRIMTARSSRSRPGTSASSARRQLSEEILSSSSQSDDEERLLYNPPQPQLSQSATQGNAYMNLRRMAKSGLLSSGSFANLGAQMIGDSSDGPTGATNVRFGLHRTSSAGPSSPSHTAGSGRKKKGKKKAGRKHRVRARSSVDEDDHTFAHDDHSLYGNPVGESQEALLLGTEFAREVNREKRGPQPPPLLEGERFRPVLHLERGTYHSSPQPFCFQVYHHPSAVLPEQNVSEDWAVLLHPEHAYSKGELLLPVQSPSHLEIVVRKLQSAYRGYTARKWWWRKQLREVMEINFQQADIPSFDVFDSETSLSESILIKRNDDWKDRLDMMHRRRNAQFGKGSISLNAPSEISKSKSRSGDANDKLSRSVVSFGPGSPRRNSLGSNEQWDVNPHRSRRLHHAALKIWMMADPNPVNRSVIPERHNPVEEFPCIERPVPYHTGHNKHARPIRRVMVTRKARGDNDQSLVWSRIPRHVFNTAESRQEGYVKQYNTRHKAVTSRAAASKVKIKKGTRSLRDLDMRYGKRKAVSTRTEQVSPRHHVRGYRSRGMTVGPGVRPPGHITAQSVSAAPTTTVVL